MDDQPSLSDPELKIGSHVYSSPDFSSHRGIVVSIKEEIFCVDFFDWIAEFSDAEIELCYMETLLVFVANSSGTIVETFGICSQ